MSDPEIVRLKKKVQTLTEFNVQLQEQVQELSLKIGEYQARNIEYLNNNLLLKVQKEKATNEENLRLQLQNLKKSDEEKILNYKKENEKMLQEIADLKARLSDNEIYIQKLQIKNEKLQKDLINFTEKHEAQDYIEQIKRKEQEISKLDEQRDRQTRDYNDLCDKMEEVIAENRVLRQMADLPENFGIDMSKIRLGDRIKIEDYKAKIRTLENEVDNLESERTKLKHRLMFLNNSFQINEYPFNLLSKEQKLEVSKFAQDLYEGKKNIQPEKYELIKENEKLKAKINFLEDENYKFKTGIYNNINNNENLNKLIKSIVKEEREKVENNNNTNINNLQKTNLNTSSNYNNLNIILNSNNSNNFKLYKNNNFEQVLNKVNKKENQINSSQSNSSQTTNSNFIFFNIFSF
jgi:hypothetical protein